MLKERKKQRAEELECRRNPPREAIGDLVRPFEFPGDNPADIVGQLLAYGFFDFNFFGIIFQPDY